MGAPQLEILKELSAKASSKIVLLVMDGLGGLPETAGGKTELETAATPNLDKLAETSVCGLTNPILEGITPGSGPAHLALFGYDPIKYLVGRGVLAALGIGFPLEPADLAVRVNFAAKDSNNLITDRRAGRIATEKSQKLCALLEKEVNIPGVETFVRPVKEHRAALIVRGKDLCDNLNDTDPQKVGLAPRPVVGHDAKSQVAADILNEFVTQANKLLAGKKPANTVLLRGIACYHPLPSMKDQFKLKAAAIAGYPMYKGVSQLVGMEVLDTENGVEAQVHTLQKNFFDYDFFFVHIKKTDSAGEDANFAGKVAAIEEVDKYLPELLTLEPDVLVITGDHSTPAILGGHSWHPVPLLLNSAYCRPDNVSSFGETACLQGGLGIFPAQRLMPLMLANALRLNKYGA